VTESTPLKENTAKPILGSQTSYAIQRRVLSCTFCK